MELTLHLAKQNIGHLFRLVDHHMMTTCQGHNVPCRVLFEALVKAPGRGMFKVTRPDVMTIRDSQMRTT